MSQPTSREKAREGGRKRAKRDTKMKHFSHKHSFVLSEKDDDDKVLCQICNNVLSGSIYGCNQCKFYIHKSCAELPRQVQHLLHPCTLLLQKVTPYYSVLGFKCNACDESNKARFSYNCRRCKFHLDLECALLPTAVSHSPHEKIRHFLHRHPLTLCKMDNSDEVLCSLCQKSCSGSAYRCIRTKCEFNLDRSCAELRRVIQHPFHRHHSLTLGPRESYCKACCRYLSGPSYHCQTCNFDLHVECASLKPSLTHKGHHHLLTFVEHMYGEPLCSVCNSTFSGTSYLRCVECDYNVHLLCIPLPQKIKHQCHLHPLTLEDCLIEDDSGEYYCDAHYCEQERDPTESVYYCQECKFICHVNCVISVVLSILKDQHGNVELRRVNRAIGPCKLMKKGLGLGELLASLTKVEKREIKETYYAWRDPLHRGLKDKLENATGALIFESYNEEDFLKFIGQKIISKLPRSNPLTRYWDRGSEIIEVGKHKITQGLAGTLENLICKHGDFTAKCVLISSRVKLLCLVGLVGLIHKMANTEVREVTRVLLYKWWCCFNYAQHMGFEVQFVFDHLNKVAYSRFVVVRQLVAAPILKQTPQKIIECHTKIKELTKEIKELKERQRKHLWSTRFAGSSISEEHLTEALELSLDTAATGLL